MVPKPEPKNWLVYQLLLISETIDTSKNYGYLRPENKIIVDTAIRNVVAFNKEEAIGKFVLATFDIEGKQRIGEPRCFELDNLTKIL